MPKTDKPNLLYILTDQQRFDTMSCYGNMQIDTPAMNALASGSFVFENAYVTQPVCTPSRATQLTGLYPHASELLACNIPLPEEIPTIAELVSDEYTCGYYGKWHLGDEIFSQHGFTDRVATEDSYRRHYSDPEKYTQLSAYHDFLIEKGFTPDSETMGEKVFSRHFEAGLDDHLTKATFLGDKSSDFINEHAEEDDPWMLMVGFLEPHPPHTGPYNDMYDPATMPTGESFMKRPDRKSARFTRVMGAYYMESEDYGCDMSTEEGWKQLMARYWGNVTLVDRALEKIFASLEESGQADNTIVVLTSDHGEMMGNHGILGKTVMYEESIKVPMVVRVPWLNGDQKDIAGNFSHIDTVPTLLSLMGQPVPENIPGRDLTPVLNGDETLENDDVFIQWNRSDGHPLPGEAEVNPQMQTPWRTVVTSDRWKLNLSAHDQCEMFDLNSDPNEMLNLYEHPAHASRVGELTQKLRQWQQDNDDGVELPGVNVTNESAMT